MTNYAQYFSNTSSKNTPQTEPMQPDQTRNNAGGFGWTVDKWTQLDRFLILGSEGGTYYVTERNLTLDNAKAVVQCLQEDGVRVVDRIVEVSDSGRAARNDPAIFALALALKFNDQTEQSVATRRAAATAVPKVCRTFYHLSQLAESIKPFGGWGRVTMRAFDNWYKAKSDDDVAYQMIKYQNRNGWTHRDILLKAHVKPENDVRDALYNWAAQGWDSIGDNPHPNETLSRVWAFEKAKQASTVGELLQLISDYNLPRECVPTEFLNDVQVWEALLERMPLTAMIRNLAKMTSLGLLTNMSDSTKKVVSRLQDAEYLKRARIHPLNVLNAMRIYGRGQGFRGSLTWSPVPKVIDALDDAFYASFDFVEPTGKRICLALDVSGSMGWNNCVGMEGLTAREASAAMAMVTMRTEDNYEVMAFSNSFKPLSISPRQRLDDVVKSISNIPFGGTDCSIPMKWAQENGRDFDSFVVYTDSETWAGNNHPKQALDQYRKARVEDARLAVMGMASNPFTIADPQDPGMLDIAGLDSAVPQLLNEFISGKL
jgi:60 kDa SS-A/Ro ribonucleoprotein